MPSFLFNNGTFFADGSIAPQPGSPVAGATVQMAYPNLYLTPAGTLATLTIKLPTNPKPGQTATITSTTAVTALTMQSALGTAITGAPTALVASTKVTMQCVNSTGSATSWAWIH